MVTIMLAVSLVCIGVLAIILSGLICEVREMRDNLHHAHLVAHQAERMANKALEEQGIQVMKMPRRTTDKED